MTAPVGGAPGTGGSGGGWEALLPCGAGLGRRGVERSTSADPLQSASRPYSATGVNPPASPASLGVTCGVTVLMALSRRSGAGVTAPSPEPGARRQLFLPPLFLPPFLDALGVFAIFAARSLLMPFLRRPSYCLSSLTDGP
jgi:ABC-type Fe3+ transport system permease subunit